MGFFSNLRSERLITQIKSTNEPLGEETLKSVAKLKGMGAGIIEPVIQSLADADKNATVALVDVLSTLVSNKTFPLFVQGLCDGGPRIAAGVGWALTSSRGYSPGLLLDALNAKGMSKSSLMDVIHAQRDRFNLRELLNAAYAQEPNEKAARRNPGPLQTARGPRRCRSARERGRITISLRPFRATRAVRPRMRRAEARAAGTSSSVLGECHRASSGTRSPRRRTKGKL